jgi:alpha-1,2-mannosyltransferase
MAKKIQKLSSTRPEALSLILVLATSAVWVLAPAGPLDRFGTLKGTDFAQFYVAARLVVTGAAAHLYDWSIFAHGMSAWVPGPEGLLYLPVYPPPLAVLLAPLGRLSYLPALGIWTLLSAALYCGAGALLIRGTPALSEDKTSSYLLLLGFPAFAQLLLFGQVSAVVLMLVTLAWLAWREGRPLAAGLALGTLALKPQMLAVSGVAALLLFRWRLVIGIGLGVLLEAALSAATVGTSTLVAYGDVIQRVSRNPAAFEPKAEQIQSLRGLMAISASGVVATAATLVASAAVIALAARAVRRADSADIRFAAVVLAGALVNPHLYVYDLVILIVPLALIAGWLVAEFAAGRRRAGAAVGVRLLYWLPLVAPVLGLLRIQLMAPAMAWVLWTLGSNGRARPTGNP